jgi:hypothetical protein
MEKMRIMWAMKKVPSDHGHSVKSVVRRCRFAMRCLGLRLSAFGVTDWRPFNKVVLDLSSGDLNLSALGCVARCQRSSGTTVPWKHDRLNADRETYVSVLVIKTAPDFTLAGGIRSRRTSYKQSRYFFKVRHRRFVPNLELTFN